MHTSSPSLDAVQNTKKSPKLYCAYFSSFVGVSKLKGGFLYAFLWIKQPPLGLLQKSYCKDGTAKKF
jgi:hypothetical protein